MRAGRGVAVALIWPLALGACGDPHDQQTADSSVLPVVERPQTPGHVPSTPAATPTRGAAPTPDGVSATVTVAPTTVAPDPTATSEQTEPASERERLEAAVVELTNVERAAAGCAAVHVDERLVAAARAHSEDMAERDFFDHTNPDGETPWDRTSAAGYDWAASENIAWGYRTAEAVVAGWMDSDGHRRNILDCEVVAVGVGVADSSRGPYWTQVFGRR